MTYDDIRKIALVWPEVEDGSSYGTPALKVRKKMLVRLKEDGDSLVMPGVPLDEREMLIESQPKIFYFTVRDEAVANKIRDAEGKRVALHYKEKRGIPSSCFGDTRYFIADMRVLGN